MNIIAVCVPIKLFTEADSEPHLVYGYWFTDCRLKTMSVCYLHSFCEWGIEVHLIQWLWCRVFCDPPFELSVRTIVFSRLKGRGQSRRGREFKMAATVFLYPNLRNNLTTFAIISLCWKQISKSSVIHCRWGDSTKVLTLLKKINIQQ